MPTVLLTDLALRSLKPGLQTDYWDSKTPGFGVRVGKRTKTFVAKLQNRRATIGKYPSLSVQEARRRFLELKVSADPQALPPVRYSEAVDTYLATRDGRPSTRKEAARLLAKHFPFGARPIAEIDTREIDRALDGLRDRPSECLHAFRAARTFFRWAVRRRYLVRSPCEGMDPPTKETSKDRVLSQDELIAVWNAAGAFGHPFGDIVRLLILTGARRSEIGGMARSWINPVARTISVPPEVAKNGRRHLIGYGDLTASVLAGIPERGDFVFPARGRATPFSGYSSSFAAFKKGLPGSVQDFTLHDLRRTYATSMARLGVPIHVVEKLLNHVSGSFSGIVSVYQKHRYWDEQVEAVRKYEEWLAGIV